MARVAIIGGGGFAKEVIEIAELLGHKIVGIFALENSLKEYKYLGYKDEILSKRDSYDAIHIAIGAVNQQGIEIRNELIDFLQQHNIPSISLISPKATIAKSVTIKEGTFIAHEVLISCDTQIGNYVIINQRAVIGHDCKIEDRVSIAPLVFLGGGVIVEKESMIGVRATIRQGIKIAHNSTIGMGSLVIKSTKPYTLTLQMPSKTHKM